MRGKSTGFILAGMAALLLAASSAWPDAPTSTLTDPVGDSGLFQSCGALGCAAYQDIVQTEIARRGGLFVLGMTVAVPDKPLLEEGVKQIAWAWFLDTDPETHIVGYPFSGGEYWAHGADFVAWIVWDGRQFSGQLIDRRPLLTGGGAILSPVPFKTKGTELTAVVDGSLMMDPSSFHQWFGFTILYNAPLTDPGNFSWFIVDHNNNI
jgi:hypothetical protein